MTHTLYCIECETEIASIDDVETHLDANPSHHVVDTQSGGDDG